MIELGQLERRHEDFARQNARVIVVSLEGAEDAQKTQADFPHLRVLTDAGRGLSDAVGLIHRNSSPTGGDTSAPTTIIVDQYGKVRWLYRSSTAIARLSPEEVLQAVATTMPRANE